MFLLYFAKYVILRLVEQFLILEESLLMHDNIQLVLGVKERREPMNKHEWHEIIKNALRLIGHFLIFISSIM